MKPVETTLSFTRADRAYLAMLVREKINDWLKEHGYEEWKATIIRITYEEEVK
jgi:hypothetical protein